MERDKILLLDDAALSALCELSFCFGSGPGGQKRNKSSSAVRVKLAGTDFEASDCSERSQHRNRSCALRKLRMKIALECRSGFQKPDFPVVSVAHRKYPLYAARLFDALAEERWDVAPAARRLGMSPTALLKILSRDPEVWRAFSETRRRENLPVLHPGA